MAERGGLGRLLAGQAPADLADWLDMVAVGALLAFHWEAPPVAFAWLAAAMAGPPLTLGLLAGVGVDRWPLRRTLLLSNLGRGAATGLLLLVPSWGWLVAVVALRAVADAVFGPAKQAALVALVPPDRLVAANALSQGLNQATKVVAPALGALLLLGLEPRGVFAVNAALSLLAALLALALPPMAPPSAEAPRRLWAELGEGVSLVARTAALRGALGLTVASTFAVFLYDTQIPPVIRDLGQRPEALGLCLAAAGAGGLGGSFGVAGLRAAPLAAVAAASFAAGLLLGGLGLKEVLGGGAALWPLLALFAGAGFCSSLARVPLRAMMQAAAPPGMMGRVAAIAEAAAMAALLVAPFLGAALAAAGSSGTPFVAGGALLGLVAAGAVVMARGWGRGEGPG